MGHAIVARALFVLYVTLCVIFLSVPLFSISHPLIPTVSAGLPRYIDEYDVPTPKSGPLGITVDTHGVVWFTESNVSKIASFDPANQSFREYSIPGVGDMWGINVDHAGDVWFTQYSGRGSVNPGGLVVPGGQGRLLRFNPQNGNLTIVDIPTAGSFPMRLLTDLRNRVWFTEFLGNKIGQYDPATNHLAEYRVPSNLSAPADLTLDENTGVLWFTEAYAKQIGAFDTTNQKFIEYPLGAANPAMFVSSPVGISLDQDGNVWSADHGGNWITKFNPYTRQLTKFPTHIPPPTAFPISIPNGLLIDGNGRVWFCEHGGNSIGYYDPDAQQMVEFPIPTGPVSNTLWIALAPNGDVWFTEWSSGKIGVVHAGLPVPLALRASLRTLTVESGGQSSVSLLAKVSQSLGGNGTFRYSWSSYSPNLVEVTFSPKYPLFAGLADTPAQAQIQLSSRIIEGNYTLGLGLDAGGVRVWSMIQVQVTPATTQGMPPVINETLLIIGLVVVAGVVGGILLRLRRRRPTVAAKSQSSA